MMKHVLRTPELGFVVATRAALALGAGLLLSRRLSNSERTRIGTTLVAIGALTTIPAAMIVLRSRRRQLKAR